MNKQSHTFAQRRGSCLGRRVDLVQASQSVRTNIHIMKLFFALVWLLVASVASEQAPGLRGMLQEEPEEHRELGGGRTDLTIAYDLADTSIAPPVITAQGSSHVVYFYDINDSINPLGVLYDSKIGTADGSCLGFIYLAFNNENLSLSLQYKCSRDRNTIVGGSGRFRKATGHALFSDASGTEQLDMMIFT